MICFCSPPEADGELWIHLHKEQSMEGHRGSSQVGSGGARAGKPPSPASWGSRGGLGAMSFYMCMDSFSWYQLFRSFILFISSS